MNNVFPIVDTFPNENIFLFLLWSTILKSLNLRIHRLKINIENYRVNRVSKKLNLSVSDLDTAKQFSVTLDLQSCLHLYFTWCLHVCLKFRRKFAKIN